MGLALTPEAAPGLTRVFAQRSVAIYKVASLTDSSICSTRSACTFPYGMNIGIATWQVPATVNHLMVFVQNSGT